MEAPCISFDWLLLLLSSLQLLLLLLLLLLHFLPTCCYFVIVLLQAILELLCCVIVQYWVVSCDGRQNAINSVNILESNISLCAKGFKCTDGRVEDLKSFFLVPCEGVNGVDYLLILLSGIWYVLENVHTITTSAAVAVAATGAVAALLLLLL